MATKANGGKRPGPKAEDQVDLRDSQGDERDDVDLEDRVVDDPDRPQRIAPNLDDDNDDTEEVDRGRKPQVYDDPRDELVKNIRADRDAGDERTEAETEEDEDADEAGEDRSDPEVVIVRGPGSRQPAPAEETVDKGGEAEEELDDKRPVTMIVDGVKVKTTLGDMRARAQMNSAADARLKEANRILDEAKATVARTAPAPDQRDQAERRERSAPVTKTKVDPARLVGVVDKITMSADPEEGAKALAEELDKIFDERASVGQTSPDLEPVRQMIQHERIVDAARADINTALTTIAKDYADVNGDERLSVVAYRDAHLRAVEQLRAVGVNEEDLKRPPMEVFEGYAMLARDPQFRDKLKPIGDVFIGAAKSTHDWASGARQPASQPAQRQPSDRGREPPPPRIIRETDIRSQRKVGVQAQPRSASIRADLTESGAPRKADHSVTIAEMARQRQ